MRRTKIVATIGPASRDPAVLERLLEAGVDVVRLNFSHGEHEQHLQVMKAAREIAARDDRPLALLQDLSGPKIRTGKLRGGEPIELRAGAQITITTDETVEGTAGAHLHHLRPAAARRARPATRSCSTTATSSCAS